MRLDINQHPLATETLLARGLELRLQKQEIVSYEPRHEKTGFLHMGKQRRRSASR